MRPAIDNGAPQRYSHLDMRLKKMRQEEDKRNEIYKQNVGLLQRIARQMSHPRGVSNVDANYHVKEMPKKPRPGARQRREELEQIEHANQVSAIC